MHKRFLGIFVNPLYVQNEGLNSVFDNLEAMDARAICTIPQISRPSNTGGRRFPDLHIDGYRRLLARPVWGQREIHLDRFLSFRPDPDLYAENGHRPAYSLPPSELDPGIPRTMLDEAHRRGMRVHMLFHPTLLPAIRSSEQPTCIDGATPTPPQVALNGCLNNPAVQAYGLALAQDIAGHYPELDGLFPDWTEFAAYQLHDHFTCFCKHCEQKAWESGYDWHGITRDVQALWNWLHALTPTRLETSRRLLRSPSALLELLSHYPGWLEFLRFKADTVITFYQRLRKRLDENGFGDIALSARGWPPPWNRSTGMDYRRLAEICAAVTPKLFLFDYSALPRWYGQLLQVWNPDLSESALLEALVEWMALPDDIHPRAFADYQIPAPEHPHTARLEAYQVRLNEVAAQVGGRSPLRPFAHAYLPDEQWRRMITLVRESPVDGMWVQMYGYLSDSKMQILKHMWT